MVVVLTVVAVGALVVGIVVVVVVMPHTLENFVTHQSKKISLSGDCRYVRMSICHLHCACACKAPYLKTKKVASLL